MNSGAGFKIMMILMFLHIKSNFMASESVLIDIYPQHIVLWRTNEMAKLSH